MPAHRFRTHRPPNHPPNRYPAARVILGYLFLGHLVGCCLLVTLMALAGGSGTNFGATLAGWIVTVLLTAFFGFFIGTPPALLCGLVIAVCRLHRTAAGLAAATAVGAAAGWLFGLLMSQYAGKPFFFDSLMHWVCLSAAASALLGAILLPRREPS